MIGVGQYLRVPSKKSRISFDGLNKWSYIALAKYDFPAPGIPQMRTRHPLSTIFKKIARKKSLKKNKRNAEPAL
jgi:hypothetical protein